VPRTLYHWTMLSLTLACASLLGWMAAGRRTPRFDVGRFPESWQRIEAQFYGIFLEALPFLLLGVFISSILHLHVPDHVLRRLLPSHPVPGVLLACLIGIILPVCECGMIPIVRSLIRKGMPAYVGIPYILAAPILNPVTFASTRLAFQDQPAMAWYRMGLALVTAATIGWILYGCYRGDPLRISGEDREVHTGQDHDQLHDHRHDHRRHHVHIHTHDHDHTCGHNHDHAHDHFRNDHPSPDHRHALPRSPRHRSHAMDSRLFRTVAHASDEFFEMGKYLLLGAFLTAVIQTCIGDRLLHMLDAGPLASHLLMMGFAYVISLCSTSDAFVAASFSGTFHPGALLSFLVFGPMLDFKATLMMLAAFRRTFVARLSLLIAAVVLGYSLLLENTVL